MVETTVRETMEKANKIAHEIGGIQNDALRFGLHGVKTDIVGDHPLQSMMLTEAELNTVFADNFGSAFCLKMDLDTQINARPPGAFSSSMLGYEALTGSLDDFGFEDYNCLNDPSESETYRSSDMHHGMEVWRGMSKGPICPSFI